MNTVTGAPSAPPYPKDVKETDHRPLAERLSETASSLDLEIGRIRSMLYAMDQAIDDAQHDDTRIEAIGRIIDYVAIADKITVAAARLSEGLHDLAVEARHA